MQNSHQFPCQIQMANFQTNAAHCGRIEPTTVPLKSIYFVYEKIATVIGNFFWLVIFMIFIAVYIDPLLKSAAFWFTFIMLLVGQCFWLYFVWKENYLCSVMLLVVSIFVFLFCAVCGIEWYNIFRYKDRVGLNNHPFYLLCLLNSFISTIATAFYVRELRLSRWRGGRVLFRPPENLE